MDAKIKIEITEGEARFIAETLGLVTVPAISKQRDAIVNLVGRISAAIVKSKEGGTDEKG